jgi:hypothetical protein
VGEEESGVDTLVFSPLWPALYIYLYNTYKSEKVATNGRNKDKVSSPMACRIPHLSVSIDIHTGSKIQSLTEKKTWNKKNTVGNLACATIEAYRIF